MTSARSSIQVCLGLLVVASALAACDDPAPPGAQPGSPATAAPSSLAEAASAASSAQPAVSAEPVTPALPVADGDTPVGSASGSPADPAPFIAGGATPTGGPAAPPPAGAARGRGAARTGILGAGEADKFLPKGQATRVRLIDAGAEPREALRYALTPARTTALEMGLTMTIELAQGDRAVPSQKIPRIGTLLDLTTAAAPVDGGLGVSAVVRDVSIAKDAGLPQQVADKLLPHLSTMKGLTLGYVVTPEGRVRQASAQLPGGKTAGADATLQQMSQSLESMIAPFPEEPVGLGARWEVVARFDSSGTELVQWSTFELRERDATGARLGLEVQQAAAKADVQPPNLPAGVTAKLAAFSSLGRGDSQVEFASPAPRAASMKVDSTMTLQVLQGGAAAPQQTTMKSSMLVDLGRKGSTPPAAAPAAPSAP